VRSPRCAYWGFSACSKRAGVSLEPAADLAGKEGAKMGAREEFAKRVAFNLFRYMESFGGASGDQIVVPTNILDSWFKRFQEKFSKDPDFLARQEMPM
jgi:protein Hikeshi